MEWALAARAGAGLLSDVHVLDFSGRGPAGDGRVKPDVVLPGLVQSARCAEAGGESVYA